MWEELGEEFWPVWWAVSPSPAVTARRGGRLEVELVAPGTEAFTAQQRNLGSWNCV